MAETIKAQARREREGFFQKYISGGIGLDIGCGHDPVTSYCDSYDRIFGDRDATTLPEINYQYDWVYSSHCLEHLEDPSAALRRWGEVVRPGGYLVVAVPHRDLYEKRLTLPSRWNADHKWFFVPGNHENLHTLGLQQLLQESLEDFQIEYLKVCDEGHTITDPDIHSDGEYQIEAVLKKNMRP